MPGTILSFKITLGNRDKFRCYRQSEYKKFLETSWVSVPFFPIASLWYSKTWYWIKCLYGNPSDFPGEVYSTRLQGSSPAGVSTIACHRNWPAVNTSWITFLPSVHFHSLTVLSGVTSQMNCLFSVCFEGNPNQTEENSNLTAAIPDRLF